mgnify:CR=1 FL=1|nr:MAG TPA_asm: NikA, BACTERIAL CONJUGATION, RELAXASE, DNA [Caudoviricetes sp.]
MKELNRNPNYGGKRENAGRKEKYAGGRQQLAISCSIAQKTAIQEAAKKEGLTTAEYVLRMCGVSSI